jgi:hypothetical protein
MEEKRAGGSPLRPERRTRRNRITAVGNDLYSADSRGFLNPFLRVPRCARLFPPRPPSTPPSAIRQSTSPSGRPTPSATDLVSPSVSLLLPLLPIRRETCVQVPRARARALQRFRETEIALSRKSWPRLFLAPRVTVCVSRALVACSVDVRKHRYPILLLSR